jgi:HEAT repeat protein
MPRTLQLIVFIGLVLCIGLLVPYRILINTSISAPLEFIRGQSSWAPSDSDPEADAKKTPVQTLQKMLASPDPTARGSAAKILDRKGDPLAVPALIQSLDDNVRFRDAKRQIETSVSDISKAGLAQILKRQISLRPYDISLLLPLFAAADRGSPMQREAVIEILGQLREPLLKRLLPGIPADDKPEPKQVSTETLAGVDTQRIENALYENVRDGQIQFVVICAIMILLLLSAILWRVSDKSQSGLILLSLAPLVLLGTFLAIILTDFTKSKINDQNIDLAIINQDLIALKTMLYHDYSPYPGDSYVARHLLQSCDENVVHSLIALPSVQSTDDEAAVKNAETELQWILARFIALNFGSPRLEQLVSSPDSQVRGVLASVLGKLGVRNEYIIATLTLLAKDEDPRVRKTAEESMARVQGNPVWMENRNK